MSFWELAVIAVVALIVLGPEKLPTVARTLGRWFYKLRQASSTFQTEMNEQLKIAELDENIAKAKEAEKQYGVQRTEDR